MFEIFLKIFFSDTTEATNSSQRLIMEKVEIDNFCCLIGDM